MITIKGRDFANATFSLLLLFLLLFLAERACARVICKAHVENTSADRERARAARNGDEFTNARCLVTSGTRAAFEVCGLYAGACTRDPIVSISETTWKRPCDALTTRGEASRSLPSSSRYRIWYQTTSVRRKRAVRDAEAPCRPGLVG